MLCPSHIETKCAIPNSENIGIVCSHEKEQAADTLNKVDESLKLYAEQNKPDKTR